MITATRISRALGVLGVVGFMAHATTSLATSGAFAQDPAAPPEPAPAASAIDDAPLPAAPEPIKDLPPAPAADAPPLPDAPEPVKDLPPPPDEPALDLIDPPSDPIIEPEPLAPIKDEAAPVATPEARSNPLPPARGWKSKPAAAVPPAPADADDEDDHPAARPSPRPTGPDVFPADDPDAQARSFLERNRREAEEQLKALRDEAAQLKGRLARVEAGILRWEALTEALDRSAQERAAAPAAGEPRAIRSRGGAVQYGVPVGGVIIQSQPITRSDFVPVPQPR